MNLRSYLRIAISEALRQLRRIGNGLSRTEMPIWLTLIVSAVAAFATGLATYYLAPAINAKFEVQKARSQYIMDNMKLLNEDTASVLSGIYQLNQELKDKQKTYETSDRLRMLETRLLWRANEYETMFTDAESQAEISRYARAIENIEPILNDSRSPLLSAEDIDRIETFSSETKIVLKLLSKRSDWSRSFGP